MADEYEIASELDLKGLQCPMPMVRVSQEMARVPVGSVVKAVATDPACKADITAWARLTGNQVLSVDEVDGAITLLVKRLG